MSLARYTNALATSSGSPMRPRGMVAISGWIIFSGSAATMSVLVMPGATAFTRMPLGASSRERHCVRPLTAYLDVGYPQPDG